MHPQHFALAPGKVWINWASPTLASQREIFYVCIYIYLLGERSEPHTSESARNFLCLYIYIIIYLYVLVRSSGGAWLSSPTVHLGAGRAGRVLCDDVLRRRVRTCVLSVSSTVGRSVDPGTTSQHFGAETKIITLALSDTLQYSQKELRVLKDIVY